ncbi:MAG: MFS transporter [Geminicoccaceae bacterium]|nr:MFS transporter [Geminicoccaceae bacterium]
MASPSPPAEAPGREILLQRAYWRLFWGQALGLIGTGVATVALALLAYRLVGRDAAAVFGTALAIKMATYVLVTPIAAGFVRRLPPGPLLVALDLARAALLIALPFVQTVPGLFLLILLFQVGSALFVPTAQAVTSELLPDEQDYAEALARSRLVYELEGVLSPAVAGLLLFLLDAPFLFDVAAVAFVASAVLLAGAGFPRPAPGRAGGPLDSVRRGLSTFLAEPALRGLTALNLAAALATATVTVVTVHLVRTELDGTERMMTAALVAAGAGSMVGAVLVPMLTDRLPLRATMLAGGFGIGLVFLLGTVGPGFWTALPLWAALGLAGALAVTPAGMLLRALAPPGEKLGLYATHFALANAASMLAYPAAGWLSSELGSRPTLAIFAALALAAVAAASRLWPPSEPHAAAPVRPFLPRRP